MTAQKNFLVMSTYYSSKNFPLVLDTVEVKGEECQDFLLSKELGLNMPTQREERVSSLDPKEEDI
jgi:hypothetical protein